MGYESALSETWHCSLSSFPARCCPLTPWLRSWLPPGPSLPRLSTVGVAATGKGGSRTQTATSLARVGEAETSVKLRFSRYLPVAWLLIPGLHHRLLHHCEVFPPTTAASASARFRQMEAGRAASGAVIGGGAAAVSDAGGGIVPPKTTRVRSVLLSSALQQLLLSLLSSVETAGGLTRAMKPSAPRSAAQSVAPVVGAEPRMTTARRSPARSLPLRCASGTSLSLDRSSPPEPGHQRRSGTIPRHSSAASALSCGPVAGLTALCCAGTAASDVDASPWAAALVAGALVPFVSEAIPLLRENDLG